MILRSDRQRCPPFFAVSLVVRVGATTDGACSACLTPSFSPESGSGGWVGGGGWGRHKRGQYPT